MPGKRKLVIITGICAFTLTLAACSGSSSGNESSGDIVHNSVMPDPAHITEIEILPERPASPLDEYLSLMSPWGDWESLDAEGQKRVHEAQQVRRENFVAACMHRFGFDYIPNLGSIEFTPGAANEEWRPQERAWVAQWGYAFVSQPFGNPTGAAQFGIDPRNIGPNEPLLADMSQSEQDAWWGALWGTPTATIADELGFFSDYTGFREANMPDDILHCQNWGGLQVSLEDEMIARNDEFAPLMQALRDFRESLLDNPSPADHNWSTCMADKGFPGFSRQIEAAAQINIEFNEINTGWESFNTPEMADLQEREIETALADFDCRVATNYAAGQQAHIFQRETQFVNDNRAALNALRDAIEQGR